MNVNVGNIPPLTIVREPDPPTFGERARRIVVRLVLLAVVLGVLVGLGWLIDTRAPTEPPQGAHSAVGAYTALQSRTEAAQWLVAPDLPDYYGCDGADLYLVQLTPADRALVESMIEGEIRLPWVVTGCEGVDHE